MSSSSAHFPGIDGTLRIVAAGLALGLAIITKGTTYLFAPPFLLWLVIGLLRKQRIRALIPLGAIALLTISLNAGHWIRNVELNGHPLGPGEEARPDTEYANAIHTPKAILSNTIKYLAFHFNTPWPEVHGTLVKGLEKFHETIGFDINDPRTSFGRERARRFRIARTQRMDELDGNPFHLLLIASCLLIAPAFSSIRRQRSVLLYGLALLGGFMLFCFIIKWAIWNTRVQLPLFVLAAPFAAIVPDTLIRKKWILHTGAIALLVLGLPWLFACQQRPILSKKNIFNTPRTEQLFTHNIRKNSTDFHALREYLADKPINRLGLYSNDMTREYIIWHLLKPDHPELRIQHINVKDVSKCKTELPPFSDFQPDLILSMNRRPGKLEEIIHKDTAYTRVWHVGRLAIYEPRESSHE